MELSHLHAFATLAEELHFGRAALRLGIAQPALSLKIQALEAGLGVTLFERSRRHVALSENGRLFLPEALATLAQAERAKRVAHRAARGELGQLAIGFTGSTPFSTVMPRIIGQFRTSWPDIRMSLRELSTSTQLTEITDGTLDIGFVRPDQPGDYQGIEMRPVLDEKLLAVLAADHPLAGRAMISLADLAGQPFIMNPRLLGTGLHDKVLGLCRGAGFMPDVVLEAQQMSTIVGLAAAGIGVSVVPEGMRHVEIEGVRFIPLAEKEAHMALLVAYRGDDKRSFVARFIATAMANARTP